MDELVRRFLVANQDNRQVTTDAHTRYLGVAVNDRSLIRGDNARRGTTLYQD
jgi:hypothetical protein